jgi:hypothetical protein
MFDHVELSAAEVVALAETLLHLERLGAEGYAARDGDDGRVTYTQR